MEPHQPDQGHRRYAKSRQELSVERSGTDAESVRQLINGPRLV
jgi:hypothetical protein